MGYRASAVVKTIVDSLFFYKKFKILIGFFDNSDFLDSFFPLISRFTLEGRFPNSKDSKSVDRPN